MSKARGVYAPRMLERTALTQADIIEAERLIMEGYSDSSVNELNEAEATFQLRDLPWLYANREFATKGIRITIAPKHSTED